MPSEEAFGKVVKWEFEKDEGAAFHIWKNDEVNSEVLAEIISSGDWDKLEQVSGFFAATYKTADRIYLLCDRLGVYPLFFYLNSESVYISPKIPSILNAIDSDLSYSIEGVVSLLMFGHHLADETIFSGIKRCNGGETIVINNSGQIEQRISWKKKHIYQDKNSISEDKLSELFIENIRRSIPPAGNIYLSLSGGFDSRAVLGGILECVEPRRINTVTFGGTDTYDYTIAKLVANKAGIKNRSFEITDELFDDRFLYQRAGDYSYSYPVISTQPEKMICYWSKELTDGSVSFWGVGGDAITGSHLRAGDILLRKCNDLNDFAHLLISKRYYSSLKTICEIVNLNENDIIEITTKLIERSNLNQYDIPWQFLDAWDIFVRGRMELISVLPFDTQTWRCPHLSGAYFDEMSTQCYEEKLNQNVYRKMLSSKFTFLFSLPTRRLRGRSLVGGHVRSIYWKTGWRIAKIKRSIGKIMGQSIARIGRNYGREEKFLNSEEGQKRLSHAIDALSIKGVLRKNSNKILELSQRDTRLGRMLLTLGYGFNK